MIRTTFILYLLAFPLAILLEAPAAGSAFICRSSSQLQTLTPPSLSAAARLHSAAAAAADTSSTAGAAAVAAAALRAAAGAERWQAASACLCSSATCSSSALYMVKHKKYQLATDNLFIGLSDAQVQRNLRRKQMAIDYRPLRQLYIQRIQLARSMDEKLDWQYRLQKLPRDSSPTRYRNRCHLCGRPRGFFRFFGLCRIHALEHLRKTDFPGFTKAEW